MVLEELYLIELYTSTGEKSNNIIAGPGKELLHIFFSTLTISVTAGSSVHGPAGSGEK